MYADDLVRRLSSTADIRDGASIASNQLTPKALPRRVQKLNTLELGRGLAALFVLLYHYKGLSLKYTGGIPSLASPFVGGHAGVEYFFVLSGFIIYLIHRNDIGEAGKIPNFFAKRIIRIIPMYWAVITFMLIAFLLSPQWGSDKHLDISGVLCDYFLIPHEGVSILPPSWTLKREAFFYLIFGLTIARPALGAGLFLFWQAAILLTNLLALVGVSEIAQNCPFLLDIHNIGFAVGVFCAGMADKIQKLPSAKALVVLLVLALLAVGANMCDEWIHFDLVHDEGAQTFSDELAHSLFYTVAFGFVVFSLVLLERHSFFVLGQWVNLFGASSYLLYIIHEPLGSFTIKVLAFVKALPTLGANEIYVIEVVVAVTSAIVLHLLVEKPVTRRLRHLYVRAQAHNA